MTAVEDIDPGIREVRRLLFAATEVVADGLRIIKPGMDAHWSYRAVIHHLTMQWGSEAEGRAFIGGFDEHGAFTLRRLDALAVASTAALDRAGCPF